jgi:hypothetical protein
MKKLLLPAIVAIIFAGCGTKDPAIDIWTAAATGNTEAIEQHIRFGTELDLGEPTRGSSPLIIAALVGYTDVVRLLVENGADVNYRNMDKSTALHTAAFFCHREIVEFLLEQGAQTDIRNVYGRTPLDSVSGEWSDEVAGRYSGIAGALQLPVNLDRMRAMRPVIAEILSRHREG